MGRVGKGAILLVFAALAIGCGAVKRPYAHDPLFRNRDGVWGDADRSRSLASVMFAEPAPPHAPNPASLPTLEWEREVRAGAPLTPTSRSVE